MVSLRIPQAKLKKHCCGIRAEVRKEHQNWVEWMKKKKYKGEAKSTLPDNLKQFQDCKVLWSHAD